MTKTTIGRGLGSGSDPNSKKNLKPRPMTPEMKQKASETKKKHKKFKEVFDEVLTDSKKKMVASDFVDMLFDKTITINNRCRILEIILKILGEDGTISAAELNELTQHIELEIK